MKKLLATIALALSLPVMAQQTNEQQLKAIMGFGAQELAIGAYHSCAMVFSVSIITREDRMNIRTPGEAYAQVDKMCREVTELTLRNQGYLEHMQEKQRARFEQIVEQLRHGVVRYLTNNWARDKVGPVDFIRN